MRLFDWLKPKTVRHDVTPSALAQILEGGSAVVLDQGQTYVKLAEVKHPEAKRIADSLRDFPGDWVLEKAGHYLTHIPSGFMLWCGNEEYGVAQWDGHKRIPYSNPERAIIWKALEPLAIPRPDRFGGLPKVKITGKRGMYWCVADGHPWAGAGASPAEAYRSWARAVSIAARKDQKPNEVLHVWSGAA